MVNQWDNWCRLCGEENGERFNVFIKNENFFNISEAIQTFLSITINISDEIPQTICSICHEFIISMLNFSEKSTKVQQMFIEIQLDALIDLKSLRKKYNLINDMESSVEEKPSLDDDNKFFIDCGQSMEINNHHDDTLSLSQDIKKPKTRRKSLKNNENITKDKGLLVTTSKNTIDNDPKLQTSSEIRFMCEICKKSFATRAHHTRHLRSKHSMDKDPFSCKHCGKLFNSITMCKAHENTHLPYDKRELYECKFCEKKFNSKSGRWSHIHTVHSKKHSVICEECGKEFPTAQHLSSHKLTHTDVKPFECSKCPAKFKCRDYLRQHMQTHGKNYICPICGLQLNTKFILRDHMIVHSDERKYECNFCGKKFKRISCLNYHLIQHIGVKPYQCKFCIESFVHDTEYRRHIKKSHPGQYSIMLENHEQIASRNFPPPEQLKALNEAAKKSGINYDNTEDNNAEKSEIIYETENNIEENLTNK